MNPTAKRGDANRSTALWLLANIAAAGFFLFVASAAWLEPELREYPGAEGGGGVIWVLCALPIVALFALLNAGMFLWACIVRRARGSWPINALSWLSIPVWLCAIAVDHVHH